MVLLLAIGVPVAYLFGSGFAYTVFHYRFEKSKHLTKSDVDFNASLCAFVWPIAGIIALGSAAAHGLGFSFSAGCKALKERKQNKQKELSGKSSFLHGV